MLVILLVRLKPLILMNLLTYAGVSTFMVFICFPTRNIKQLLLRVLMLYVCAFVIGGALNTAYFNLGLGSILRSILWGKYKNITGMILLSAVLVMIICGLLEFYEQQITKRQNTYSVTLCHKGKSVAVKALYDTGNCLFEPLTKKPVSICTENTIRELFGEKADYITGFLEGEDFPEGFDEKVYVLPYMSVGNENGLMTAVEIDSVQLHIKGKIVENKKMLVGFCSGRLNSDEAYGMILNSAVMSDYID